MTYDIADDLEYVTREVNSNVGNRSSVNILGGGEVDSTDHIQI